MATYQTDTNGGTKVIVVEPVEESEEEEETTTPIVEKEEKTDPEPSEEVEVDPDKEPEECIGACPTEGTPEDGTAVTEDDSKTDIITNDETEGTKTELVESDEEDPKDDQDWLDDFGLNENGESETEDGNSGTNQVIEAKKPFPEQVTEEPVEEVGLSAGIIVVIVLGALLCILPVVIYFVLKCVAKYRP